MGIDAVCGVQEGKGWRGGQKALNESLQTMCRLLPPLSFHLLSSSVRSASSPPHSLRHYPQSPLPVLRRLHYMNRPEQTGLLSFTKAGRSTKALLLYQRLQKKLKEGYCWGCSKSITSAQTCMQNKHTDAHMLHIYHQLYVTGFGLFLLHRLQKQ